jgi:hypothetical protein
VDELGRQRTLRLRQDSQERFNCCVGSDWDELDSPWGVIEVSDMFTRFFGGTMPGGDDGVGGRERAKDASKFDGDGKISRDD